MISSLETIQAAYKAWMWVVRMVEDLMGRHVPLKRYVGHNYLIHRTKWILPMDRAWKDDFNDVL